METRTTLATAPLTFKDLFKCQGCQKVTDTPLYFPCGDIVCKVSNSAGNANKNHNNVLTKYCYLDGTQSFVLASLPID